MTWELTPPRIAFDFRPGRPAFADVPYARWCRLLGSRARRASLRDLEYGPPQGRLELREAIANRLRLLRGIDASPGRIVIVNGTQQALDLICRVLLDPGDRVLIEEPHYTGARSAFISAGGELVPARVDDRGIQVPNATGKRRAVRLAYVTPSHQFPTGVVMPVARRLELLNWASRQRAFVVEDDYDSEYRYDGPPLQALAGLDREGRVIYVPLAGINPAARERWRAREPLVPGGNYFFLRAARRLPAFRAVLRALGRAILRAALRAGFLREVFLRAVFLAAAFRRGAAFFRAGDFAPRFDPPRRAVFLGALAAGFRLGGGRRTTGGAGGTSGRIASGSSGRSPGVMNSLGRSWAGVSSGWSGMRVSFPGV